MRAKISFMYNPNDEIESTTIQAMQKVNDYIQIIEDFDNYLRGRIKYEVPEIKLLPKEHYFNEEEYEKDANFFNSLLKEHLEFIQGQMQNILEEVRDKLWELKREYNI